MLGSVLSAAVMGPGLCQAFDEQSIFAAMLADKSAGTENTEQQKPTEGDKRLTINWLENGCFTMERKVGTKGEFKIPPQVVCPAFKISD